MRDSRFAFCRIAELSAESSERANSVRNLQVCALVFMAAQNDNFEKLRAMKVAHYFHIFVHGLAPMSEKMVAC